MRGGAKEESAEKIAGWSGADGGDATTAEGVGWDSERRTAGGTQESGADGRSGDVMAGGGDTGKDFSAAADKAEAGGGRHGARPEQRGRLAGRQENLAR